MKKEPRIDLYISRAEPFARPILKHLRDLIHSTCPDVHESIKWNFPHFDYQGPFLSMAAFKNHCAFTFWKGSLLKDPEGILDKKREQAMGQFGKISTLSDLPEDEIIIQFIQEAMLLNEEGVKLPSKPKPPADKKLVVPDWFMDALKSNKKAKEAFENFSYSHKKEYVEWVTEAKREETRLKRMQQTLEWLAEGKPRNWKYQS